MAVFDPVSDPMDYTPYTEYVNFDNVDDWRHRDSDPAYFVSPNDPVPTHDNFYFVPSQTPNHVYSQPSQLIQNHSPIEMNLTIPSPSPDSQNFVNYNASSALFRDSYITENQLHPQSPAASSNGQAVHSPYQPPLSPQVSASSPGGSEGVFSSYQHSEGEMVIDSYPKEQFEPPPPPSPVQHVPRTVPEVTFDPSPEPESKHTHSVGGKGASGRPGGRSLGTHLDPKVARAAHDMRKITACWHCVLQRDKVRFWKSLPRMLGLTFC